MVTTLRREGDTWSIVLDARLVEELGFAEGAELHASAVGQSLLVVREDPSRRHRFETALEATNQQFGETLRRLAE
jgi:antitoxin component of MazEF toxin-antitoxin module